MGSIAAQGGNPPTHWQVGSFMMQEENCSMCYNKDRVAGPLLSTHESCSRLARPHGYARPG